MPPIANPQLPDYVHPSEHSSRQKYLQHTVDTLVYFYVRSHVYVEMLAVLARDEKQQQDAYNSAQVRWKGDPMVASGVFPQTPGGRQQYLMKCYQMSTANVKTASEYVLLRSFSLSIFIRACTGLPSVQFTATLLLSCWLLSSMSLPRTT